MDIAKTNETIKKLNNFLTPDFSIEVEKGILDYSTAYANENEVPQLIEYIYNTKLDEILESLCNNTDLVKTQKSAYRLAYLNPDELNPDKYETLIKKKEINEYKKKEIKSSSAFKCSKCKKNKCAVSQKQILAGDEPLTTFVTCLECGHSFSFH